MIKELKVGDLIWVGSQGQDPVPFFAVALGKTMATIEHKNPLREARLPVSKSEIRFHLTDESGRDMWKLDKNHTFSMV